MINEIDLVKELTGADEKNIRFHDDGYWSVAYVINNGELVVKFIRQQHKDMTYNNDVNILNALQQLNSFVAIPRVRWLSEDKRCIVLNGVRGTSLNNIKNLTQNQKQNIGKQLGEFLKQLHKIEIVASKSTLNEELEDYKNIYDELRCFFNKYLLPYEKQLLDNIMDNMLPAARKNLGEVIVFCHADIFEPNILIDENGKVGLIDFGNAGYFDEAADFGIDNKLLRDLVLDYYGADEILRKKVEIKYDLSIVCAPKWYIDKHDDTAAAKKWISPIRRIISKYKIIS